MRKHISCLFAVAAVGAFAPVASAQFFDDFESSDATPDSWATQDANPGQRTDNDPANTTGASSSAVAGQWFHHTKTGVPIHNIQVTSFNPPVAAGGNNYLRLHRANGTDSANISAAFTDWNNGLTSGTITAEWDMYIPSGQDGFVGGFYVVQFLDNDHSGGTTGSLATFFFRNDGSIRQSFNFFQNNPDLPGVTAGLDRWQRYVLVNDLSAQTYTLSIDGVTSASFGYNYPYLPNGGAKGLLFNGQENKEFYIDNVRIFPEPASISLAALGAMGLLRRRR